jgi:hypothetical protein
LHCPFRQEQAEVEQYYVRAGYLFPTYYEHEFYWFGYKTTSARWPTFEWMDPTVQRRDKWGTACQPACLPLKLHAAVHASVCSAYT